jgi:hypothetical protein
MVEIIQNWSFPKDPDGKVIAGKIPVHDEFSHGGSALYYAFATAFPLRKGDTVSIR